MALSLAQAGSLALVVSGGGQVTGTAGGIAFTASGGTAPYRYELLHGQPPPGMAWTAGGLTGMPTARGSFLLRIRATDSAVPPNSVDSDQTVTVS